MGTALARDVPVRVAVWASGAHGDGAGFVGGSAVARGALIYLCKPIHLGYAWLCVGPALPLSLFRGRRTDVGSSPGVRCHH